MILAERRRQALASLGPQLERELSMTPWRITLPWSISRTSTVDMQMHPAVSKIGYAIDAVDYLRIIHVSDSPRKPCFRRFGGVASAAWLHRSSWTAHANTQLNNGVTRLVTLRTDGRLLLHCMRCDLAVRMLSDNYAMHLPELSGRRAEDCSRSIAVHESARFIGAALPPSPMNPELYGSWILIDLEAQKNCARYDPVGSTPSMRQHVGRQQTHLDPDLSSQFCKQRMVISMHPDGLLCATTSNTSVLLWDLRTSNFIAKLPTNLYASAAATAGARQIDFASNGYSMGIRSDDGSILIYDLRKRLGTESSRDYSPVQFQTAGRGCCFAFHPSGLYMAAAIQNFEEQYAMHLLSLGSTRVTEQLEPLEGTTETGWGCVSWDASGKRLVAISYGSSEMFSWTCDRLSCFSI
jgi:hypothetical protein